MSIVTAGLDPAIHLLVKKMDPRLKAEDNKIKNAVKLWN